MNETKRMLTLFGVVVAIVALICIIAFWPEKDTTFTCDVVADEDYAKVGELSYENFECLKEEAEYLIAVSNSITKEEKKALNSAVQETGKGVYVVSLDDYTKEAADELKDELEYSENDFENAVLMYVKDGEVAAYNEVELNDEEAIYAFLKDEGLTKFMCNAVATEDYENLAEVDYETFSCLYEQEKPFVLVVAQTTCSYCQQFAPVINEIAGKNNTSAYVINIDQLSESDMASLTDSVEPLAGDDWGTPLTLGFNKKEIIGTLSGYTDDEQTIKDIFINSGVLE